MSDVLPVLKAISDVIAGPSLLLMAWIVRMLLRVTQTIYGSSNVDRGLEGKVAELRAELDRLCSEVERLGYKIDPNRPPTP